MPSFSILNDDEINVLIKLALRKGFKTYIVLIPKLEFPNILYDFMCNICNNEVLYSYDTYTFLNHFKSHLKDYVVFT